jgi:hypothetical protein
LNNNQIKLIHHISHVKDNEFVVGTMSGSFLGKRVGNIFEARPIFNCIIFNLNLFEIIADNYSPQQHCVGVSSLLSKTTLFSASVWQLNQQFSQKIPSFVLSTGVVGEYNNNFTTQLSTNTPISSNVSLQNTSPLRIKPLLYEDIKNNGTVIAFCDQVQQQLRIHTFLDKKETGKGVLPLNALSSAPTDFFSSKNNVCAVFNDSLTVYGLAL